MYSGAVVLFLCSVVAGPRPKQASLAMELLVMIDVFPHVMFVPLVYKGLCMVVLVTMDEVMSAMQ